MSVFVQEHGGPLHSKGFSKMPLVKHTVYTSLPTYIPMIKTTMLIKTTKRSTHLSQQPKPRRLTISDAGEDMEQKKLSVIASGKTKWYTHFGRQFDSFSQN